MVAKTIDLRKKSSLRLVGAPTTTSDDIIRLGSKPKKKTSKKSTVEKFLIGETALLAGVLAGGLTLISAPPLALPAFLGTTAGVASLLGAIREKPGLAKKVLTGGAGATLVNLPTTIRTGAGELVEKAKGLTAGQKVAGAIAGAGLVGAGALGVTKIIERIKETRTIEKLPQAVVPAFPTFTAPPTFQAQPIGTQQLAQPIGIVEKQLEEKQVKEKPVPMVTNEINVSPEINIRFSKSRKFINQQIII